MWTLRGEAVILFTIKKITLSGCLILQIALELAKELVKTGDEPTQLSHFVRSAQEKMRKKIVFDWLSQLLKETSLFFILLFISFVLFSSAQLYAQDEEGEILIISERERVAPKEKTIYFTLRLGQGGFKDGRSPIGKLGGGQLALDMKPDKFPLALSLSLEYYTNSPNPTHSYEIADDGQMNHTTPLQTSRDTRR